MSEFSDNQDKVKSAKTSLNNTRGDIYVQRNRLRHKKTLLASALRQGEADNRIVQLLEREIGDIETQIIDDAGRYDTAKTDLGRLLSEFHQLEKPWELVNELNDDLPFLLFPVRIETRFMKANNGTELWVRIFPDDIAAHAHEKTLTVDEINISQTYWKENWAASREADDANKKKIKKGAWRQISKAVGNTRAAWIISETEPETLAVDNVNNLTFPMLDPEALKEESWSEAPRSNIMPDRFVVMGFSDEEEIFKKQGAIIPSPLFMGPDPQNAEEEYQQLEGELVTGEDIAWVYDFEKAVDIGMALTIPLVEPFASKGFNRLLVLGLRLSSNEKESQILLEDLIENHHYSPDGMSVLPQGTPTNNTDNQMSGYSSQGLDADTSYLIEREDALFAPVNNHEQKDDGQRLAEALGISYEPLQHIQNAGQQGISEALGINKSLWHGTLGYYLEEMLELDPTTVGLTREFFTDNVTGRGPLPAIRIGSQPYGVLLTSDFSKWTWSRSLDNDKFSFLRRLHEIAVKMENRWKKLLGNVAHVGAAGDPYKNLLNILGLQATSAEHYRRHSVGREYVLNYAAFSGGPSEAAQIMSSLKDQAKALRNEFDFEETPKLFDISFSSHHIKVTDPLVDDIPVDQEEKLSETEILKSVYKVTVSDAEGVTSDENTNYIGWLVYSTFDDIKAQRFVGSDGEKLPVPRSLLYRMLRGALLHAYYDSTMQLYEALDLMPPAARYEGELINIEAERTVTRWEFMDADISRVMPEISRQEGLSVGQFLQTDTGLSRPEALGLFEVRKCLESLIDVRTASLERLFTEHLDLCSYRLDAWQMGCFNRRLQQQRFSKGAQDNLGNRVHGIYLGAFGWLENLQPDGLDPVENASVPVSLHDPEQDDPLFEQKNNAGFIHGPSLNHAVTAAVLRNAYITHFDTNKPEKMAVNLSSERVRTALSLLEGIRNGQALGALLGYQFERGLHDRHNDPSLNQYIPPIRLKYPLVADKITSDEEGEEIETKEARNVLDGYALLEAAFLKKEPLTYPYNVDGLPSSGDSAVAIQKEVSRMADSLDAIKDLGLAEGVYQVTQGNIDRAGAMLKAFTEGNNPIEPEIVRTPRSGVTLTQRVTLHLDNSDNHVGFWPGVPTPRARTESGLNKWLSDALPLAANIRYKIHFPNTNTESESKNLISLGLQPIDLVYLIGDDLANETTELESRIINEIRREKADHSLEIKIEFISDSADPEKVTLFELLPLLRNLRDLLTDCRPLDADDFRLPIEIGSDSSDAQNSKGYDLGEMKTRMDTAFDDFDQAFGLLDAAIVAEDEAGLRSALLALANFGVVDAIPINTVGTSNEIKALLIDQATSIKEVVGHKRQKAIALKTVADNTSLLAQDRVEKYREMAQKIFGPAFNLIPVFNLKNREEMNAAASFRDADSDSNLVRHHKDNPHIIDEWLQGVARVRDKIGTVESISIFSNALKKSSFDLKPLQLPFRNKDHWVAVEYPEVTSDDLDAFVPDEDFLSIVQWLPANGFDPAQPQSGLSLDHWNEVISRKNQTTGIAFHYNQPTTEPPQSLLLAVTPEVTGTWSWDKLVGTLHNTLDRAKLRAVEPDQLDNTAFGHLLPAIVSAVTSDPSATISTDYVHQTAEKAFNSTQ